MSDFSELGASPAVRARLAARSITLPTAVQRLVAGPLLEGRSVAFRSATGTGKTLAYLVPALARLSPERSSPYAGPELLVCAPTLELCAQIKGALDFLLDADGRAPAALLIGSSSSGRQADGLRKGKPLAAVGNPGRVLLLAKAGKLSLRGLRFLVLDEADRLVAPELREETAELARAIARAALPSLTVAACSATVSAKTVESLRPLLENALTLETDEREILRDRIRHWAIFSEGRRKTRALASFLAAAKPKKTLVFASRSHDVGKAVAALQARKIDAAGLFGGMDSGERKAALERFRSGKAAVLVSSDLAARGLDVPGISHVVALDVGEDPDVYVHRAGRTGRAGARGVMTCIGDEVDLRRLAALEKKLGIAVYPKELSHGRILAPERIEEGEEE